MKAKKKDKKFRIRSKVECLYAFFEQLRGTKIQHVLNIYFLQKQLIKDPTNKNLEIDLNKAEKEKEEVDAKLRITNSMIEEEKAKLDQSELSVVLEQVKLSSDEDMIRSVIDYFTMINVPEEVIYRLWQSRLLEQTNDQVRASIEVEVLPKIKTTIDLNTNGKANAEEYLKVFLEKKEDNGTDRIN